MTLVALAACTTAPPPRSTAPESTSSPAGPAIPDPALGTSSPTISGDRPQVPPIRGCSLLTLDEVWDAFGFSAGGQPTIERGERCSWGIEIDDEIRGRVEIEPGAPEDFEPGASVAGLSSGERVEGIGLAAVWFAGEDTGALSVVQDTTYGLQLFRLLVHSADHDAVALKEMAETFALQAAPRFPGALPPALRLERDPPAVPHASLADNIIVREQAGEWTRGEGIVATLQVLAREIDAGQVLPADELVDRSATGVIEMAREYAAQDGGDAASTAEINRLLDHLLFSRAGLEDMTEGSLALAGRPEGLIGRTAQGDDDCALFDAPGPCLDPPWTSPELDNMFGVGKYQMFTLHGDLGAAAGWTEQHYFAALDALVQSAITFEGLGQMPAQVSLTLTPWDVPAYAAVADFPGDCQVYLYTPAQDLPEAQFKQWIAGELGHCFISATFPEQQAAYDISRWWNHALAVYLSNVVFPAPDCAGERCDLEWLELPALLAQREMATTLLDRSSDNWLFFQHLASVLGDGGVLDLVGSLPPGGAAGAHRSALASFNGMDALFHEFVRGMTDANIPDTGGGLVPYEPDTWTINVSGPHHVIDNPPPFGTSRISLVVAGGDTACLDYDQRGEVRWTWRPGEVGTPGSWEDDLPRTLSGEAVYVATSMSDGAEVTITVRDVVDDPSDCEEDDGDEPEPSGEGCLVPCPPSDYYHLREMLEEWLRRIVQD